VLKDIIIPEGIKKTQSKDIGRNDPIARPKTQQNINNQAEN